MGVEIREITSREDRQRVYRFWYDIYVREMHRPQKYADHASGTVQEPLDETGHILAATENDEIVGTVRVNYAGEGNLSYYTDLYDMRRYAPFFPARTCITTKLMTTPKYRSRNLGLRLCKIGFSEAERDGMRFDFMDCNAPLKSFFVRIGYRQLIADAVHPDYGHVHPMVLVLHDKAHLTAMKSPFAPLVASRDEDFGSVEFFYREIVPQRSLTTA